MEFIFAGWVGIHPMARILPERFAPVVRRSDRRQDRRLPGEDRILRRPALSQGIGTLAAAFFPRPVMRGIDSLSLSPDSLVRTIKRVALDVAL